MKKLIFTLLFSIAMAITAMAEPVKYYFIYAVGYENQILSGWFMMDREKMQYIPESDSEIVDVIKNYKKAGNKETFEVYENATLMQKMEIATDDKGVMTVVYIYGDERQVPIVIGSKEQWDAAYERITGKKPSGGEVDEEVVGESPIDKASSKVKGGVKNVFNKGKNLFKKKK